MSRHRKNRESRNRESEQPAKGNSDWKRDEKEEKKKIRDE